MQRSPTYPEDSKRRTPRTLPTPRRRAPTDLTSAPRSTEPSRASTTFARRAGTTTARADEPCRAISWGAAGSLPLPCDRRPRPALYNGTEFYCGAWQVGKAQTSSPRDTDVYRHRSELRRARGYRPARLADRPYGSADCRTLCYAALADILRGTPRAGPSCSADSKEARPRKASAE